MNCLTCKEWEKCPVDLDIINQELEAFPMTDRFGIHCDYYKPDYITPEQYRERAGEAWPDNGAVYYIDPPYPFWDICRYKTAKRYGHICAVATEAGPPPDNWRPGEEA